MTMKMTMMLTGPEEAAGRGVNGQKSWEGAAAQVGHPHHGCDDYDYYDDDDFQEDADYDDDYDYHDDEDYHDYDYYRDYDDYHDDDDYHNDHHSEELRRGREEAVRRIEGYHRHIDNCTAEMSEFSIF